MTANSFPQALAWVLLSEGGFVNNPHDPGGATNFGVTQRVYSAWRTSRGEAPIRVSAITQPEVSAIYKAQYWDAIRADELPLGIDYCSFDLAVNSGPIRAIKFLQSAVNVGSDGHLGIVSMAAIAHCDRRSTILSDCTARLSWLRALSNWRWFGAGWRNRVNLVQSRALQLAASGASPAK